MADFLRWLAMGQHGIYVWTAYGLSVSLLLAIHLWAARRQKRLRREVQQLKEDKQHETH